MLRGTIYVPVAEWGETFGALEYVMRFAVPDETHVVLVGLLPAESHELDPDLLYALSLAAEVGRGELIVAPPLDDQTRTERLWTDALLPLRGQVKSAGIAVCTHVLRGDAIVEQMRVLVANAPRDCTLALGDPRKTFGALGDLTSAFVSQPPCRMIVAAPRPAEQRGPLSVLRRLFHLAPAGLGLRRVTSLATQSSLFSIVVYFMGIAIFARAILSWFPIDPRSPLMSILLSVTEPILKPLRRVVPRLGMIDITPMIAMIVLLVVGQAIRQALASG